MNNFTVFPSRAQGDIANCATSKTDSEPPDQPPCESSADSRVVEADLGLGEPPSCVFHADHQHLIDLAEHNVNQCTIGKRSQVSLKEELITSISRLMIDVDPSDWRGILSDEELADPSLINSKTFWTRYLEPMLDRHPLLRHSEVRFSGRGFHVLACLDEPVVLPDDDTRTHWKSRLQILQCMIPSDSRSPSLNIMTRPLNSINGKNGRRVVLVRKPTLVSAEQIIEAVEAFRAAPFQLAAQTLFGGNPSSCPLCHTPGSSLRYGPNQGICYGGQCGSRVSLSDLFDRIFLGPWTPRPKGGAQ